MNRIRQFIKGLFPVVTPENETIGYLDITKGMADRLNVSGKALHIPKVGLVVVSKKEFDRLLKAAGEEMTKEPG